MATKAFTALLCSLAIAGQVCAQEVMVARETKPSAPEPATPESEVTGLQSETTTPKKSSARKKKSEATLPTIEQMRAAGALAAGRLKDQPHVEKTSASPTPSPEVANVQEPVPGETLRKVKAAETPSAPRESKRGAKNLDAVGRIDPVRPTMIESGKQETDSAHSAKGEPRGGETHAPQPTNSPQLLNKLEPKQHAISAQFFRLPA